MRKQISDKVINRLTLYHCILNDYINKGEEIISSGQIASLLKIDDSQVRKDINLLKAPQIFLSMRGLSISGMDLTS